MGITLPTACRGIECSECLVAIAQGQSLLSAPTETEKTVLGYQGLATDQRLACQTMIVNAGELLVRVLPAKEESKTTAAHEAKSSKELPLEAFSTVVQAEVLKVMGAIDAARDKSLSIAEKLFDRFERNERLKRKQKIQMKRPPEHRHTKSF